MGRFWRTMMRDGLCAELGVRFPAVRLMEMASLPPLAFRILISRVPESQHSGVSMQCSSTTVSMRYLPGSARYRASIQRTKASARGFRRGGKRPFRQWTDHLGYPRFSCIVLSAALRRRAVAFLRGQWVTASALRQVEATYPRLVEESVRRLCHYLYWRMCCVVSLPRVCVRNLRASWAGAGGPWTREQDPLLLAGRAPAQLCSVKSRTVLCRGNGRLIVRCWIRHRGTARRAIRRTATGSYLQLDPSRLQRILQAIREPLSRTIRSSPDSDPARDSRCHAAACGCVHAGAACAELQ